MRAAVIDTSAFLLLIDKNFDVLDHLNEDLSEMLSCITTDSVIREIFSLKALWRGLTILDDYINKIFEKCHVYSISEDHEKESADHDILRLASVLGAYIVTIDKELRKTARDIGIRVIHYRESKNKLEEE
ncbi:MAG TPA: hypothetical protein VNL13_06675 [Sulfolobales archaeon]|nr:hypothetical protein [Sulfolobales archaeon]